MNWRKRIAAAALCAVLAVCLTAPARGADISPEAVLADTAQYVLERL